MYVCVQQGGGAVEIFFHLCTDSPFHALRVLINLCIFKVPCSRPLSIEANCYVNIIACCMLNWQ